MGRKRDRTRRKAVRNVSCMPFLRKRVSVADLVSVMTPPSAALVFSGRPWAQIQHYLHKSNYEIGLMGVSSIDALLVVESVSIIKQSVSDSDFLFDDDDLNAYSIRMGKDRKMHPQEFFRILIHTHPMFSPLPSTHDEYVFSKAFGSANWAITCIVSDESVYARLAFRVGPQCEMCIPVLVNADYEPTGMDIELWDKLYEQNVTCVYFLGTCEAGTINSTGKISTINSTEFQRDIDGIPDVDNDESRSWLYGDDFLKASVRPYSINTFIETNEGPDCKATPALSIEPVYGTPVEDEKGGFLDD